MDKEKLSDLLLEKMNEWDIETTIDVFTRTLEAAGISSCDITYILDFTATRIVNGPMKSAVKYESTAIKVNEGR